MQLLFHGWMHRRILTYLLTFGPWMLQSCLTLATWMLVSASVSAAASRSRFPVVRIPLRTARPSPTDTRFTRADLLGAPIVNVCVNWAVGRAAANRSGVPTQKSVLHACASD